MLRYVKQIYFVSLFISLIWEQGTDHTVSVSSTKSVPANSVKSVTITMRTDPPGLSYVVDWVTYSSEQVFVWTEGSVHTIGGQTTQSGGSGIQYVLYSISDGTLEIPLGGLSLPPEIYIDYVVGSSDKILTAKFKTQYLLTVNSSYGNPQGSGWYDEGTTANFSVTSPDYQGDTRYVFHHWSGDYSGISNPCSLTMDGPKSVTATWITKHRLQVKSSYGNPQGDGWYNEGSTAHFSVTSPDVQGSTQYIFKNWTGDYSGSGTSGSVIMNSPKSVKARWTTQHYLSTNENPDDGGDMTPAPPGGWYDSGSTVTVEATPDTASGYVFSGWSGDLTGTMNPDSVTIDGPKSAIANFVMLYNLTIYVNPAEGGTTDPAVGTHQYISGTVVPITAIPAEGYNFLHWMGDVADSNSASTNVTMDTSKSVTAIFWVEDEIPPTLKNCYPRPGALSVPKNTNIQFKAKDEGMGVELSTLQAMVNSTAIITDGADQTGGRVTITSHSPAYTVVYDPLSDFAEGSTVTVQVSFDDLALPANSCDSTYSFAVGAVEIDTSTSASVIVGQSGGTVTDTNTHVEITIPAKALEDSVEITISQVQNLPPLPDGVTGLALSYHFGPDGLVFNDSVLVRIPYTQDDLDSAGVSFPEELKVFYYHTTTGQWVELAIDSVDTINMYLFVKVMEFCYLTYGCIETSVEDITPEGLLPRCYVLSQNYPNPFNPETTIRYQIPKDAHVSLEIYNTAGQRIRTLVDEVKMEGSYEVVWDGRNGSGEVVSSGMYLVIMKGHGYVKMVKAVFMK